MSNVPFYDSNEGITVGGQTFPLWRWRQIAIAANQARQQNPNDREADEALQYATTAVRTYANVLRSRPTLSPQDIREAQPGRAAAVGMGAANTMSLGFGDEGAGLVAANLAMLPGGESPKQAYLRARDANRAFDAAAASHNPASYVGGQALGVLLSAGLGGTATAAGPLTRTIAAGAVPGATAGARALAMGAGGTIGAGLGGVAAYGSGEEGPIQDIENVPMGAGLGFLFGAGGTGFANRSIRNERLRVADEQVRAMAPQATAARIAADQELAGTRAAQRRIAESRAAEAEATRPMRIQQAENQLALSTSRRNMLPVQEQAARDRAAMTGARAEVLPEQLENQVAISTSRREMLPVTEQATRDRAAMAAARAEVLPEQLEVAGQAARDRAAAASARLQALPEQLEASRVRGQHAGLRLDEAQRTQGLRLQMVEDRAAILAMRRARMEAQMAGATDPDAMIRANLTRQGFSPELIERTLALKNTGTMPPRAPQVGVPPSQAADATHMVVPVRANPEAPQVTPQGAEIPPILQGQVRTSAPGAPAPVVAQGPTTSPDPRPPFLRGLDNVVMATEDQVAAARAARLPDLPDGTTVEQSLARYKAELQELIRLRNAKYDFINGEWVPKTAPPRSAQDAARATTRDAARNAFNAVPEELGLEAQKEAARRGAAMASEGATVAEPASLIGELESSAAIANILAQGPSRAARTQLLLALRNLSEAQRQTVVRQLPQAWKAALGL